MSLHSGVYVCLAQWCVCVRVRGQCVEAPCGRHYATVPFPLHFVTLSLLLRLPSAGPIRGGWKICGGSRTDPPSWSGCSPTVKPRNARRWQERAAARPCNKAPDPQSCHQFRTFAKRNLKRKVSRSGVFSEIRFSPSSCTVLLSCKCTQDLLLSGLD